MQNLPEKELIVLSTLQHSKTVNPDHTKVCNIVLCTGTHYTIQTLSSKLICIIDPKSILSGFTFDPG